MSFCVIPALPGWYVLEPVRGEGLGDLSLEPTSIIGWEIYHDTTGVLERLDPICYSVPVRVRGELLVMSPTTTIETQEGHCFGAGDEGLKNALAWAKKGE